MIIDIHRAGRAIPVTVQIDDKTVYFKKLMGEHHITSEFIHSAASALDVAIGDYITYPASALWVTASGENYYINQIPAVVKINNLTFKYNIDFQANFYNLNKKLFKDGANGLTDFAYNGSPTDFVNKVLTNVNEINPTWASGTLSSGIDKTLQFTNESCIAALSKIVEAYKMEYDVTNKTISLYDSIAGPSGYSFEYGRENGLYKLTREPVLNQNIITRCYGFGGQQNIPDTYRNGNKRLTFAASGMGASGYLESAAAQALYGVIEGVFVDDNIFPERTGTIEAVDMNFDGGGIGSVARIDKITKNSASGDCTVTCNGYSETMTWTTNVANTVNAFYYSKRYSFGNVTLSRISESEILFIASTAGTDFVAATITIGWGSAANLVASVAGTAGTDFNPETSYIEDTSINFDINDYIIDGQTPSVVFKSGDLEGVQCEIYSFDYVTKRIYIESFKDSDGHVKPNATTLPAVGDTYTLVNIIMPQVYVDTAEVSLQAATQRYLDENCEPHVIYTLDIDPKDAKLNSISLKAGDRVTIIDTALSVNKLIRISSIEYPLVNPYKLKIILANPIVPHTLQDRLVKAASIITKGALFSTSSPIKGMVPGANNAGADYFLNAKGIWAVPAIRSVISPVSMALGAIIPAAGIALSAGTAWGASITNNSANWNTAFGWGDHASASYWKDSNHPTTKANYGITDVPDITGTPVAEQLAIWTDGDTLKGSTKVTYIESTNTFRIDGNIIATGEISAFADSAPANWWDSMPYATGSTVGGFKLGSGLTMTTGVLSVSSGGGMVYPGAGIVVSTGSAWGTSITDASTNWNTAYGWGNHASAGYVTGTPWTGLGYITSAALSPYAPLASPTFTGTATFTNKLSIDADGQLRWGNSKDNGILTWDTNIASVKGQAGSALALGANNAEYIRILTGGNVGIGTTAPAHELDVNGTIVCSGDIIAYH